MTQALFDKYYLLRPGNEGGTLPFFRMWTENIPAGAEILEIGSGPTNIFTEELVKRGRVTGVDIDPDVLNNTWLAEAYIFDGKTLPFADASFDACVSNFVLEHVEFPVEHFREVARVLKPGGVYCLRTPNLFHYVSMSAWVMPHSMHLAIANRIRGLDAEAHDPYPTWFRANSRGKLKKLCRLAGLEVTEIKMIEPEPAYGRAHALLFYPFMIYERLVNATKLLAGFRITILLAARKAGVRE